MQTQATDFDFRKLAELGEHFLPKINAIRDEGPVIWSETAGGWLITRHADVADGFAGKYPLSNQKYFTKIFAEVPEDVCRARFPLLMRYVPSLIVNSDPPLHTRLRTLLVRAFGRRVIEGVRPYACEVIDRQLGLLAGKTEVEFVAEVGRAIMGRVIMRLLGIPEDNLVHLKPWSLAINVALGAPKPTLQVLETAEGVLRDMRTLFLTEIQRRASEPTADFLSELVHAREGTDRLSEDEIISTCVVTLLAGHDSTTNTMALGTIALARHEEARAYLLAHPEQSLQTASELMRYIGMAGAMTRIAAEDFDWKGTAIKKGDVVYLLIASANRDPQAFPNPEAFDMTRKVDMSMTFGPGIHHCIGHLLAKMVLTEFFPRFFRRFPRVDVLDPRLDFTPVLGFRGLETLHVRLEPAQFSS